AMFPASSAGVSRSVSSPSRPRCTTLTTFFLSSSAAPRHLHSFPTRRSSDLPLPLPHRRPPLGERPGGGRVRPQSLRHRGLGHRGLARPGPHQAEWLYASHTAEPMGTPLETRCPNGREWHDGVRDRLYHGHVE